MDTAVHDLVVEVIQECCILSQRWADEEGKELDLEGYAASMYRRSHSDSFSVILARQEGRVVGMVEVDLCCNPVTGRTMLFADRAYVLPEYRERGVFDAMVDVVEQKARAMGADEINCLCAVGNDRLLGYYDGKGFKQSEIFLRKELV